MNAAIFIAALFALGAVLFARKRYLKKRVRSKSRYFSISLARPDPSDPVDKPPQ